MRLTVFATAIIATVALSLTAADQPKKDDKPKVTSTKWDFMDTGPFFSSGLKEKPTNGREQSGANVALKGISIKLGGTNEAAVCFDTGQLRMAYGWTGEFLKLPVKRDGLEGTPEVKGEKVFGTHFGPGWAKDGSFNEPSPVFKKGADWISEGPLPRDWAKWHGLYVNGKSVILSYSVGAAEVLEMPGLIKADGLTLITRTITLSPSTKANVLLVAEDDGAQGNVDKNVATLSDLSASNCTVAGLIGKVDATFETTREGSIRLKIPANHSPITFKLALWHGSKDSLAKVTAAINADTQFANLKSLIKGGHAQWTAPLTTVGKLGNEDGPYVVDTITLPEDNPWKSWIRCSGLDFFKDGRIAICSVSGDVWIVSGINDKLDHLSWKRYATGLFQPLGLKIVNDIVYVVGRDQITRLRDLNNDGEADFYENFNNDIAISSFYHEFCLNLETDSKGNFYFIKGGNLGQATHQHHGCTIRVSADGSKLEAITTGHRAPNGMSIGPNDEITSSDNEGNWVPVCRINIEKPGNFYGHVFTSHTKEPPTDPGPLLCWIPYQTDNSSGGQAWVTSDKWGPMQGKMLHTSYGKCTLFEVLYEEVDGTLQGGVVKFPLNFSTGIMRARFSPIDGQLYVNGLRIWQSSGALEGAFHRVRYTGKTVNMPTALHIKKNGVEITFTNPLDAKSATDEQNYAVDQWMYHWTQNYGSNMYSAEDPSKSLATKSQLGYKGDTVEVKSVKLAADKKTVFLEIPSIKPVMQMRIRFNINAADGAEIRSEIDNTINVVPAK